MRLFASVALLFLAWLPSHAAEAEATFADGQVVGLEIGLGGGWPVDDTAYTRTLETFGFRRDHTAQHFRFSASIEVIAFRYFSVLLQTNSFGRRAWERDAGIGRNDRFEWKTWTLDVHARVFYPIASWARVYLQFGAGPGFTPTTFDTRRSLRARARYDELQVGYNVAGLGGIEALAGDHVGFFLQGGYFYVPTPRNELGDRHQSGGGILTAGISFRFVEGR